MYPLTVILLNALIWGGSWYNSGAELTINDEAEKDLLDKTKVQYTVKNEKDD